MIGNIQHDKILYVIFLNFLLILGVHIVMIPEDKENIKKDIQDPDLIRIKNIKNNKKIINNINIKKTDLDQKIKNKEVKVNKKDKEVDQEIENKNKDKDKKVNKKDKDQEVIKKE
jgi:hypothetical protein